MTITSPVTFGAGGDEPYAGALQRNDMVELILTKLADDESRSMMMDVARWNSRADEIDLTLLRSATGPLLDVGCGPGRMVQAAMAVGLEALGLDISPAAISIARAAGLPVVQGSVFDSIRGEGTWQTVLLVDGNVGIGGDVRALLRRCAELVAPEGEIVIELHADRGMDSVYNAQLVGTDGGVSESFPWAQIGLDPMIDLAAELGLDLGQAWELGGRTFVRLVTTR